MLSINSEFAIFLTLLIARSAASPQLLGCLVGEILDLIPILSSPPPASLWTQNPSPECANVNGGALYCCESTFNGDIPIIVSLAPTLDYKLNPNSINCIYPSTVVNGTCNLGTKLCCQVDALANTLEPIIGLALYCQNAPSQD